MLSEKEFEQIIEILEKAFKIKPNPNGRSMYENTNYWGIDLEKNTIVIAKDINYTEDVKTIKLVSSEIVELEDYTVALVENGEFIANKTDKYTGPIKITLSE